MFHLCGKDFAHTPVSDLRHEISGEENIVRLDVTVDETVRMGVTQGICNSPDYVNRFPDRDWFWDRFERSGHKLHLYIRDRKDIHCGYFDNVRVPQGLPCFDFVQE